jgi:hypothetical protein
MKMGSEVQGSRVQGSGFRVQRFRGSKIQGFRVQRFKGLKAQDSMFNAGRSMFDVHLLKQP